MRHYKAVCLPAILGAALMMTPLPEAAAHDIATRIYHGHPASYIDYRRAALPRWLRQHKDFMRWYRLNHAYLAVDLGWHRQYRRYQQDRFYHRRAKLRKTARYKQRRYYKRKRQQKRYYRD
ncbi:MAG: hypothetical protein HKN35_11950 [Woeseia sp.]|nr:hypothetical protein [Woeseia sp.]MBT8096922.1 hypothetical protein [Woeseia sp.]NNE61602.1 hypothetical protein [Woeseia sp.]NNL55477.1 hypothetical protein [Woeseia sp.]